MIISFRKQLVPVIALGFILCVLFFFYLTGRPPKITDSTNLPSSVTGLSDQERIEKGFLVRLKIPKMEIDVDIEHVGLTPTGAMDVPKDPWDVAWFNLGARPGEEGSAVIAGHRDSEDGKAAVFYNLDKLLPGDLVSVEDENGKIISYVVRESHLYDANADVPEVFFSESGKHLNLITCDGAWNTAQKSYAKRLVVFTDILENENGSAYSPPPPEPAMK